MSEETAPNYLRVLDTLLNERRAAKYRLDREYQLIEEEIQKIQGQYQSIQREYLQMGGGLLDSLQVQRKELNEEIMEKDRLEKKLSTELERIRYQLETVKQELEKLRNDVEPIRKEIDGLMRKTKSQRNSIKELEGNFVSFTIKRDQVMENRKEAQRALWESEKQYLVALQWEKRKPFIYAIALVLILITVLFAFVFASNQVPMLVLVPVILITFLVFFMIVIVLLRQDDKLKEENMVLIIRDLVRSLGLLRK